MPNLTSVISSLIGPGPVPERNAGTVVAAGNVAGLFPEITPAPSSSPGPGSTSPAAAEHGDGPTGRAVDVITSAPVTPLLGLIGLVVAFFVMTTRRSLRRRTSRRGPGA